jgi:hypothetical protein
MTAADADESGNQAPVYRSWQVAFLVINIAALLFAAWTVASAPWGYGLDENGVVVPIAVAAVLVTFVGSPLLLQRVFAERIDTEEDDEEWEDKLRERAGEGGDDDHDEGRDDQPERGEVDRQTNQVESHGDELPVDFEDTDEDISGAGNEDSPGGSDNRAGDTRDGVDGAVSDDSPDDPQPTSESAADAHEPSESTSGLNSDETESTGTSPDDKMRESDPVDLSKLPGNASGTEDNATNADGEDSEDDETTDADLRDEVAAKFHRRRPN